jgi:hypothetical protein
VTNSSRFSPAVVDLLTAHGGNVCWAGRPRVPTGTTCRAHRLHRSIRVHPGVRAPTSTIGVGCSALLDSGVRWWNQLAVAANFRLRRKHSRPLMDQSFGPLDHGKDRGAVASTDVDFRI